ncbi:MAG: (4Fe-4S)-binding protein [Ferruginibacter sp.]|nr:(4Fe-4S)-binding protein [Ferruginibacter sp.]
MDSKAVKKEYTNGEVTIVWQNTLCIHSANCVKNLSSVFKPKQSPWINMDNATTAEIIEAVKKCPSGALSYKLNKAEGKK